MRTLSLYGYYVSHFVYQKPENCHEGNISNIKIRHIYKFMFIYIYIYIHIYIYTHICKYIYTINILAIYI